MKFLTTARARDAHDIQVDFIEAAIKVLQKHDIGGEEAFQL